MTSNRPSTPRTCTTGRRFGRPLRHGKRPQVKSAQGEIPKDAIPTVEFHPLSKVSSVARLCQNEVLPPDKMVQNLQIGVYGVLLPWRS